MKSQHAPWLTGGSSFGQRCLRSLLYLRFGAFFFFKASMIIYACEYSAGPPSRLFDCVHSNCLHHFFLASTAGAPAVTKRLSLSLKERFGASCLGINELEPAPCSAAKPVDTPGGENLNIHKNSVTNKSQNAFHWALNIQFSSVILEQVG